MLRRGSLISVLIVSTSIAYVQASQSSLEAAPVGTRLTAEGSDPSVDKKLNSSTDENPSVNQVEKGQLGLQNVETGNMPRHQDVTTSEETSAQAEIAPDKMAASVAAAAMTDMMLLSTANDAQSPVELEPLYVKQLGDAESGYNNSNPTWTVDGQYLGFERHDDQSREIIIVDSSGEIIQTVKYESEESDDLGLDLLLPGLEHKVSYNAGITWSPDNNQFIYMSNGEDSNYDLYMGFLGEATFERLTKHYEKDGHAHWSPSGQEVAFISGRSGAANIFLYNVETKDVLQLSDDDQSYLYPQWSPHGDKLSVIYGSNENHDIYVYDEVGDTSGKPKRRALVEWKYDDLRPIWSPDGTKIAFYTNYNEENDPKKWSIAVVDAESDTLKSPEDIISKIVIDNVIPDINKGPAWMPDGGHIVYVKNDRKEYNPIELVDIATKVSQRIKTNTVINHDVSCSIDGVIAFRSQVDQWDQIFLTKISSTGGQPAKK